MKFIIFLIPVISYCSSILVDSELDTTEGLIGNIFLWTIKVDGTEGKKVKFPRIDIINKNISVKNHVIDVNDRTKKNHAIKYELMAWDTGRYTTPDYAIEILNDDESLDYRIIVDPIEFSIISAADLNNKKDYQDIKGPIPVKALIPFDKIIYSIILFILLVCMILIWKKRQVSIYHKIDYSNFEKPHYRALRRLKELDSASLVKDNYFLLSHIVRQYLESKYFIRTLEMTTKEIDGQKNLIPMKDEYLSNLIKFLDNADKVKYARKSPSIDTFLKDKQKIESLIRDIL